MSPQKREEALRKTLDYLQALNAEFIEEIDKKTKDIQTHKAMKAGLGAPGCTAADARKRLQAWRKKSYALHRRRTRLKSMKECLDRQISDLQTALDRLSASIEYTGPIPLTLQGGAPHHSQSSKGIPPGAVLRCQMSDVACLSPE